MKKYIIFVMLTGLMLSLSPAQAQEKSTLRTEREDFRNEIEDRREDFREKMKTERQTFFDGLKKDRDAFALELKTKKEEWRTRKAEDKIKFCEKVKEIITKRFATVFTQMENFQTRVGEKITQLKDAGENTTLATEALNLSKSKLADAKAKLLEIKSLVPNKCTDITPETFAKIKLGAREAKDLLKEARENLHQAVQEIKNLRVEASKDNAGENDEDEDGQ